MFVATAPELVAFDFDPTNNVSTIDLTCDDTEQHDADQQQDVKHANDIADGFASAAPYARRSSSVYDRVASASASTSRSSSIASRNNSVSNNSATTLAEPASADFSFDFDDFRAAPTTTTTSTTFTASSAFDKSQSDLQYDFDDFVTTTTATADSATDTGDAQFDFQAFEMCNTLLEPLDSTAFAADFSSTFDDASMFDASNLFAFSTATATAAPTIPVDQLFHTIFACKLSYARESTLETTTSSEAHAETDSIPTPPTPTSPPDANDDQVDCLYNYMQQASYVGGQSIDSMHSACDSRTLGTDRCQTCLLDLKVRSSIGVASIVASAARIAL
jgi:hypothetical protein